MTILKLAKQDLIHANEDLILQYTQNLIDSCKAGLPTHEVGQAVESFTVLKGEIVSRKDDALNEQVGLIFRAAAEELAEQSGHGPRFLAEISHGWDANVLNNAHARRLVYA